MKLIRNIFLIALSERVASPKKEKEKEKEK